jgi:hypothetical protein
MSVPTKSGLAFEAIATDDERIKKIDALLSNT